MRGNRSWLGVEAHDSMKNCRPGKGNLPAFHRNALQFTDAGQIVEIYCRASVSDAVELAFCRRGLLALLWLCRIGNYGRTGERRTKRYTTAPREVSLPCHRN